MYWSLTRAKYNPCTQLFNSSHYVDCIHSLPYYRKKRKDMTSHHHHHPSMIVKLSMK